MKTTMSTTTAFITALLLVTVFAMIGCTAKRPASFLHTPEPGWATIELRQDLDGDDAWEQVVDILARRLELEMVARDGGYVRTSWLYTWLGDYSENYRVRVIAKFSPDGKTVGVKSEANYLTKNGWLVGTDTQLLETIKTDVMGVVGRTTR